jgi:hypothetical protein
MGELEAIGEVTTGALAARAMEPAHAAHGQGQHACLNCGTALIGAHCHRCGQAGHVHRTTGAILHEIVHGVFHFDGKLWKTLPLLAWRPGELTRRYVTGERARFVSPMALFLFSIFSLFAVFSMVGLSPPADLGPATGDVAAGISTAQKSLKKARTEAVEERDDLAPGDPKRVAADRSIADLDTRIAALSTAAPGGATGYTKMKQGQTGWPRLDHGIDKAMKNPSLMLYKLQSNSYKFSWLLIPLSLPFMWLMFFWKRQYKVYDHAVFVTYSIAFMSLLFIAITVLGAVGVASGWLAVATVTLPPIHLYRQLRGAYELRRWSALLRTVVLLFFIDVVVTLFALLLLGLGLVG